MIRGFSAPVTRQPVPFYVAASHRRWLDAARRFVGPFAHAAADEPTDQFRMAVRVEAIDPARVRSAVASTMTAVEDCFVLWEVDATNCSTITLAIAQIAVSHHDVMQFVAIDRQKRFWSTNEIAVIAELGVACILNRPEDLAVAARLVWRHGS